jgi:hypothetical protein
MRIAPPTVGESASSPLIQRLRLSLNSFDRSGDTTSITEVITKLVFDAIGHPEKSRGVLDCLDRLHNRISAEDRKRIEAALGARIGMAKPTRKAIEAQHKAADEFLAEAANAINKAWSRS